jgi:hypothetical protein
MWYLGHNLEKICQNSTTRPTSRRPAGNPGRKDPSKHRTKAGLSKTKKNHRARVNGKSNNVLKKQPKEGLSSLVLGPSIKTIEELLEQLDDKSLKRSHQSVYTSFSQMDAYIKKIKKPFKDELRLLLDTYRDMAEEFYDIYERTLLEEIKRQRDLRDQSAQVVEKMKDDIAFRVTWEHLNQESKAAGDEFEKLKKDFPALLQNAIDKLRDEWQRLDDIAAASQSLARDKDLIESLDVVVEIAALSVGIEDERVIVVPGREFALYFFSYLDNFAVLTVPIYSVQAPWEWSIFWHELAGHQVQRLERGTTTLSSVAENLIEFHKHFLESPSLSKEDLILNKTWKGAAGYESDYLGELFSATELTLDDLGNFEHQFERMLAQLPKRDQFPTYEFMQKRGWCVEWFKELFEDAFSVLSIGPKFLNFFEDILSRHNIQDGRHPPVEIRLGVANALLDLAYPMNTDSSGQKVFSPQLELSKEDKTVVEIAAKQILKFISLLRVSASRKLELSLASDNPETAASYDFFVVQAISLIYEDVIKGIQNSIDQWSKKIDDGGGPIKAKMQSGQDIVDFFKTIEKKKIPMPRYQELLAGQNYRQLQALSFYDVDFGYSAGLTVTFKDGLKNWMVSAVFVANNSLNKVFDILGNTPAMPLPDRTFSLTDLSGNVTWYSISPQQFNNHKSFFTEILQ